LAGGSIRMTIPILPACALASWWQGRTSRQGASSFPISVDVRWACKRCCIGDRQISFLVTSCQSACLGGVGLHGLFCCALGGGLGSAKSLLLPPEVARLNAGVDELVNSKLRLSWHLGSRVKGVQRSNYRPECS
jgi:hypothetical protein